MAQVVLMGAALTRRREREQAAQSPGAPNPQHRQAAIAKEQALQQYAAARAREHRGVTVAR